MVEEFRRKLEDYTSNTPFTHDDHVRNIKGNIANPICPKCGIQMVLRTAQRGPAAGSQFWGCSNYPTCKMIKNLA
jgi:ssDNA-binding Zn-finger/Zn-ribbon topoisomerase 1